MDCSWGATEGPLCCGFPLLAWIAIEPNSISDDPTEPIAAGSKEYRERRCENDEKDLESEKFLERLRVRERKVMMLVPELDGMYISSSVSGSKLSAATDRIDLLCVKTGEMIKEMDTERKMKNAISEMICNSFTSPGKIANPISYSGSLGMWR